MTGSRIFMGKALGLLLAALLALSAGGCLSPLAGGGEPQAPPPELPARWQDQAASAIRAAFPEAEPKILYLGEPKPARVRYRYWTDRRLSGLAGLAALKAKEPEGRLLGPGGPWLVLFVFGQEGEVDLVAENLEATDVDPPIYSMTVVDVSKGAEIRLPRPLSFTRELRRELMEFSKAPWEELPAWQ
jgi:hypothetical protein